MITVSKKCNRCGKSGLEWNKDHHDKTGKWQLMDHKKKDGEWCVRNNFVKQKETKIDVRLCELCSETNFGKCIGEEGLNEHKTKFHPNGETLSELDYIHEHLSAYTLKRYWKHDPHYEKYV